MLVLFSCNNDDGKDNQPKYTDEEIEILTLKGSFYYHRPYIKDNYKNALECYLKAGDKYLGARIVEIIHCYYDLGDYKAAFEFVKKHYDGDQIDDSLLRDVALRAGEYETAIEITLKKIKNASSNKFKEMYYQDIIYPYYKLKKYDEAKKYYGIAGGLWFIPIFISEQNYSEVDKIIAKIDSSDLYYKDKGLYSYIIAKYYFEQKNDTEEALKRINIGIANEEKMVQKDIAFVEMLKKRRIGWDDPRFNRILGPAPDPDFDMESGGLDRYAWDPIMYKPISDLYELKAEILKKMGNDNEAEAALKKAEEWKGKRSYRDFIKCIAVGEDDVNAWVQKELERIEKNKNDGTM